MSTIAAGLRGGCRLAVAWRTQILNAKRRPAVCWPLPLVIAGCLVAIFGLSVSESAAQAQANNDTVLYFFTNDGCAPCLMVAPAIQSLHQSGYPVRAVKVDQHPQFSDQMGIDRTPTVVMVQGNRIVKRRSGLIDGPELQQWFAEVGYSRPPAFDRSTRAQGSHTSNGSDSRPSGNAGRSSAMTEVGTKVVIDRNVSTVGNSTGFAASQNFSSPTMHRGTSQPRTRAEQRALAATVKLRVEDPDGISFATGTVIHTHGTESLVMTCGHVFRDSGGAGRITVEYDFYGGRQTATGRLIDYDSDARDVALVAVRSQRPIPAAPLADRRAVVRAGMDVFSIGCDRGANPTIRHTRIKNRAAYDGALKYDIFGRPVDGRSGGGLFTPQGELVGVCNSAAVEVDEGIYTALNTLHWQLATTGLSHLFESDAGQVASVDRPARRLAEIGGSRSSLATEISMARGSADPLARPSQSSLSRIHRPEDLRTRNNVAGSRPLPPVQTPTRITPEYEVMILMRSKRNPQHTEKIMIDDPTPELIQYLGQMNNRPTNR